MAPATTANGKPKRKRQRRRRQQQSDSSSDSSSSSSSSESESSSLDDEEPAKPTTVPTKAGSDSSSSDDSSSSSDSSSSESDLSDFDMTGGGRRRGRGRRNKAAAQQKQQQQQQQQGNVQAGTVTEKTATMTELKRPYPSRSPSPQRIDPAHVPLGSSLFPLLKPQTDGQAILQGQVPGDEGYKAGEEEEKKTLEVAEEKLQRERAREQRFGEWWRARLVSEFEGDLGGLAAEPGLTPSRLELLLSSLTTLSSLHTTTSTAAAQSRSIWLHDPAAPIDPLSTVAATDDTEGAEEWGKTPIGGQGDVEVGEEGVEMDEKRSKKGKSRRKSKGKTEEREAAMDVDE
ncbi:uncharacterized protein JCM6883_005293 [Sporobolomyces salmoneus]|uniref:uncharacterized protein n=1 Tax=Sporobolomyces salmoneus TaxID=183962 RepID=UPI0031737042